MTAGSLAAMIDRLDPCDLSCDVVVGIPAGDRWTRVQDVLDVPAIVRAWFDEMRREYDGHAQPDVCVSVYALAGHAC